MTNVVISGTGYFHPEHAISNDQLVDTFNKYVDNFNAENAADIEAGTVEALAHSSSEFIEKASGIKQRYLMDPIGVTDPDNMFPQLSDLASDDITGQSAQVSMMLGAAKQALAEAKLDPSDIDLVINSSSITERAAPSIAVELARDLGTSGFAYDMAMACSSATFGMNSAIDHINGGTASKVLVVTCEYLSPAMNYRDRDSHFIFGDACVAMVLEAEGDTKSGTAFKVLSRKLFTQFSNNVAAGFGSRVLLEPEKIRDPSMRFTQNGRTVFKELVPMVVSLVQEHLASNDLTVEDMRRMWLHQANINMNKFAAKKLLGHEASNDESPIILDEFANTGGAGLIIAFNDNKQDFKSGEKGVICSFGAGYSIGSLIVERV